VGIYDEVACTGLKINLQMISTNAVVHQVENNAVNNYIHKINQNKQYYLSTTKLDNNNKQLGHYAIAYGSFKQYPSSFKLMAHYRVAPFYI
jgi:hypothetical protein